MPDGEIFIETEDAKGATAPLYEAWVYWRAGGATTLLRTDKNGKLFQVHQGDERTKPWVYWTQFKATFSTEIDIYYSRGAKPIPDDRLNELNTIFFHRTITQKPAPAAPNAPVSPNNTNTLVLLAAGLVRVPKFIVLLDKPAQLSLWPLMWELPSQPDPADGDKPSYQTANIRQKGQWWQGNPLQENAVAQAAPDTVTYNGNDVPTRPRERGLLIKGRIDARATSARVKFLDRNRVVIPLRKKLETDSQEQQEAACELGAADGDTKSFKASVFFRHRVANQIHVPESVDHFGPAYIMILSDQTNPPIVDAFPGHLCGMQTALVDDFKKNHNGQERGPVPGETDDKNIVNFTKSPTATPTSVLAAETQARRMTAYEIVNQERVLDSTQPVSANNPSILKPQMPMWMAEAQVVGLDRTDLEDLQSRAYYGGYFDVREKPPTVPMNFEVKWHLKLEWNGPDNNCSQFGPGSGNEIQRPNQSYAGLYEIGKDGDIKQTVELNFNSDGKMSDAQGQALTLGTDGSVPHGFKDAQTTVAFPIAGRRAPKVVTNVNRPWGRHTGATEKPSLLIEWQPAIKDGDREIMRGGDGLLNVLSAKVHNQRLHVWSAPEIDDDPDNPDAPGDPDMRTPFFRVRSRTDGATTPGGDRIPEAQAEAVINALVAKYFNDPQHNQEAHVALLPLACWQATARAIFRHENRGGLSFYRQYDQRASGLRTWNRQVPATATTAAYTAHFAFGTESGMPLFGPPHGYGFGQLDDPPADAPPANADTVWSFVENIKESVRRIFEQYARGAYTYLTTAIISSTATRLETARETVRRNSYPAGAAGTAQFNQARATAQANATAAGQEFLDLANGSADDQQRQRAIYQRELVRRYNGGREFKYEQAAGVWQWLVHTSITSTDRQPYPNQVLNTAVAEPGPTAFNQAAQYGPETAAAAQAPAGGTP
jgi:hypothetical protein